MRGHVPGRLSTVTRVFDDVTATLRTPKVSDATAWAAARHAADERLRPAFDTGDEDWEAVQSEQAFVERCLRFRRPMREGLAVPGIVLVAGPGSQAPAVLGEVGIDSVDPRTGTGEFSAWSRGWPQRGRILAWTVAVVTAHAFGMPTPLRRLVAPQPVTEQGAPQSLSALKYAPEVTLSSYRRYSGEWTAHRLWVVHNTFSAREAAETLAFGPP